MEASYKFCQSCGMPMKKDPEKGGSHADGAKSIRFCSYCYQNGDFTYQETYRIRMIWSGRVMDGC
ncbi:MAG: zinc ribbon domain-containing protein [Marinilabiliaceae bacterium]